MRNFGGALLLYYYSPHSHAHLYLYLYTTTPTRQKLSLTNASLDLTPPYKKLIKPSCITFYIQCCYINLLYKAYNRHTARYLVRVYVMYIKHYHQDLGKYNLHKLTCNLEPNVECSDNSMMNIYLSLINSPK